MSIAVVFISFLISLLLMVLFFTLGKKNKFEKNMSTGFECGFSSYFYSRFSFSIQFFLVGMIFLFLDLELCVIFPLFLSPCMNGAVSQNLFFMVTILLLGLVMEWKEGKLDWIH